MHAPRLFVVVLCLGCVISLSAADDKALVVVPIQDAAFVPVMASLPDGPQMAVLWGDPAAGPSAMLMKLKKGSNPLHTHTADYHMVVLSGIMKHWGRGQSEADAETLKPGSYCFQPGGQAHAGACLTDECLIHIVWSGPRDGALASDE
jgi:quercetin dioxygenase-like cupin family protein